MPSIRGRAAAQPAPDSSELRAKILQASVELIEEKGLAQLSMREVARRAGVTHQAPYHYFTDREAILGELAEVGFRMLSARMEAVTAGCGTQRISECIVAMGRTYVEFACQHPAHFRIMFRPDLVDPERCPGARAEGDQAFGMLTRIVHSAIDAGLPAVPSEAALVALLWSVGHGLSCLILDGPLAEKIPTAQRDEQIRDVLNALGAMLDASLAMASRTAPEQPSKLAAGSGKRVVSRKRRG